MTTSPLRRVALAAGLALTACASPPASHLPLSLAPSRNQFVYTPDRVRPGELSYAPDGSTFAPVLTERFTFPTERQANDAYVRLTAEMRVPALAAASVRLFGCKPGLLDSRTTHVLRVRSPAAHCATDFIDGTGRPIGRVTANFRFDGGVWHMSPAYPPREPVPWFDRESSPRDRWRWLPGRDRYE